MYQKLKVFNGDASHQYLYIKIIFTTDLKITVGNKSNRKKFQTLLYIQSQFMIYFGFEPKLISRRCKSPEISQLLNYIYL